MRSIAIRLLALGAVGVLASALCGCGNASTAGHGTVSQGRSPASETGTAGGVKGSHNIVAQRFALSGKIRTSAGYSYRASAAVRFGMPTGTDSVSAPPSEGLIDIPASGELTIRNTTAGRDAPDPLGLEAIDVDALYRTPTAVCPVADQLGGRTAPAGLEDALHAYVAGSLYCIATLVAVGSSDVDTLGPGRSLHLRLDGGGCITDDVDVTGGCVDTNPPDGATVFAYTKPHLAAALKALATRPRYLVLTALDASNAPAHSCLLGADGTAGWEFASASPAPTGCD